MLHASAKYAILQLMYGIQILYLGLELASERDVARHVLGRVLALQILGALFHVQIHDSTGNRVIHHLHNICIYKYM